MLSVLFGSNWFVDTNGLVSIVDETRKIRKELFKIELRSDNQPMVTVEIRDNNGNMLGKAYRSTSFVGVNPDYEEFNERNGSEIRKMGLRNKKTGEVVFELTNLGSRKLKAQVDGVTKEVIDYGIEINGVFHVEGLAVPIVATKDCLEINTNKISHCKKFGGGFGIELSPNSICL